jgi:hypothetical protein
MTTMLMLELPESTTRRRIRDAVNEEVRTITVQSYLYLGSDWRETTTAMTSLRFGDLFIVTALPVTGTIVGSWSRHTFCIGRAFPNAHDSCCTQKCFLPIIYDQLLQNAES